MNAILGITRPGDFGADMMHYNVHKTFTGPHGGGGPGAGPIAVRDILAPYLPVAGRRRRTATATASTTTGRKSIGRVRSFFGNVGILVRGYCYIRTLGPDGLQRGERERGAQRQLPAEPGQGRLRGAARRPLHARVRRQRPRRSRASGRSRAMDIAKRLLDFGFHAPTVYFPLVVPEALMIEPTETESKETLDAFADALLKIKGEDPELLRTAPTPRRQPAGRGEGGEGADLTVERRDAMSTTMPRVTSIVFTPRDVEIRKPQDRYARVAVERTRLVEFQGIEGDAKGSSGDRQLNIMLRGNARRTRRRRFPDRARRDGRADCHRWTRSG